MHPSIIKTGGQLESASSRSSQLSCPLCPKFKTRRGKAMERHLDNHIKRAVHFRDILICRCNLSCRHTGHYHCPYCAKTVMQREDIALHVSGCQKKHNVGQPVPSSTEISPVSLFLFIPSTPQEISAKSGVSVMSADHSYTLPPSATLESPTVTPQSCQPPPSSPSEAESLEGAVGAVEPCERMESNEEEASTAEQSEAAEWPSRVLYLKSVKCPHCSLVLYKKNLLVHVQRKHPRPEDDKAAPRLQSEGVQNGRCPFALPQGRNGICVPAYVQSKSQDNRPVEKCESKALSQIQSAAQQSLSHGLCEHASSLECFSRTAYEGPLKHEVLEEMLKLGILRESKVAACKMRLKAAEEAHAPLSLWLEVGDLICFSVHEPKVCPFCCFGRVMVTYKTRENTFHCPFAKTSKSCGHKNVAKWSLFQTRRELFVTEPFSSETSPESPPFFPPALEMKRNKRYVYEGEHIPETTHEDSPTEEESLNMNEK
ncbi:uncharacterized protein PAE49_004353 [Odontesthes bonariensis]|uniref:uncharacterized protein LOC142379304 n=1 Tax=Odontesthes bonariensis TaxID=219752 RepID=UPI003F58CCBE